MRALIIVQARTGSTRLPGKVLANLAGVSMLEFVLLRLRRSRRAWRVLVATTIDLGDDPVAALSLRMGIPVVRGSRNDLVARFVKAHESHQADFVIRATGDNPFVCPDQIDTVIRQAESGSGYVDIPGLPLGVGCDGYSAATLQRLTTEAQTAYQREHLNAVILDNPKDFDLVRLTPPAPLNRPDVRLTVDTAEDLERARAIVDLLPDSKRPWTTPLWEIIRASDRLKDTTLSDRTDKR